MGFLIEISFAMKHSVSSLHDIKIGVLIDIYYVTGFDAVIGSSEKLN